MKKSNKEKDQINQIDPRTLILQSQDLNTVKVKTPEWGMDVYIRSMSAGEKDRFTQSILKNTGEKDDKGEPIFIQDTTNFSAKLLVNVICSDPNGKNKIFTEEDAPELAKKSSIVVERCLQAAQKLNALLPEDVENLEKNSEGISQEGTK